MKIMKYIFNIGTGKGMSFRGIKAFNNANNLNIKWELHLEETGIEQIYADSTLAKRD